MRKLHLFGLSFLFLSTLLTGCVTQAEHSEALDQLAYYKEQSTSAENLSEENRKLKEDSQLTQNEFGEVVREMEDLKAANINLHRSYKEVLERLEKLKYENDEFMQSSSSESVNLQQRLAEMRNEMDAKDRKIQELEYELYQKETMLNRKGGGFDGGGSEAGSDADYKMHQIASFTKANKDRMAALAQSMSNALAEYNAQQVNVMDVNGKVHLVLGQELMFGNDAENVSWEGRNALRKVADVLTKNRDLKISVIGNTSSDGIAARNWDLSVIKATAVVKVLSSYGVAPENVTASGRGFYNPVTSNQTLAGRAENSRTEIILSPDMNELFKIINR